MSHPADAAIAEFARLRPRLESDLATCIAPELQAAGATDVLIVSESDLRRRCRHVFGYAAESLRSLYRDEIGDRGHVEGPAVVVADLSIAAEHAGPKAALQRMVAVSIHEVGHLVQQPIRWLPVPQKWQAEIKEHMENNPPSVHVFDRPEPEFPYGGHDDTFARLTIHLAERMRQRGWEFPDDYLWTPSTCGLSYGRAYAATLKDESHELISLPLSEIVTTPPPEAFTTLYEMNRQRALRRTSEAALLEITGERPAISRPPRPIDNLQTGGPRTEKMLSLFTRIRQKEVAERESDEQKYKRFVLSAADGTEPGEDELGELMAVLKAVGKTAAEFEADVSRITERRRLAAAAGQEAATRAEIRRVEESAAAYVSETQAILHQRQTGLGAIRAPLDGLRRQLEAAERARTQLRKNAPAETVQRHADAQRAAGAAAEAVLETNRRIVQTEAEIRSASRPLADAEKIVNRQEAAEQIRQQLSRVQAHLADLMEQRAAAESALVDAREGEQAAEAALFDVI